jgi:hypothetical protein
MGRYFEELQSADRGSADNAGWWRLCLAAFVTPSHFASQAGLREGALDAISLSSVSGRDVDAIGRKCCILPRRVDLISYSDPDFA